MANTAKFFAEVRLAIDEAEHASALSKARGEPDLAWIGLPRKVCGRYAPEGGGCLRIAADLAHTDWILRFHDALIHALLACACQVQITGERKSQWVEVQLAGEAVRISFAQEYDKVSTRSGRSSIDDGNVRWSDWDYRPRDTFKLKMTRQTGGLKQWIGTAAKLESRLREIVGTIIATLQGHVPQRRVLRAEEAAPVIREGEFRTESERWSSAVQRNARRQAARKTQLNRALLAAKAIEEHACVMRLIEAIEARIPPGPGSNGLRAWVELVRSSLVNPLDVLVSDILAEANGTEIPQWSPEASAAAR